MPKKTKQQYGCAAIPPKKAKGSTRDDHYYSEKSFADRNNAVKFKCPLAKAWPVHPVTVAHDGKIYERSMVFAEVYKNGGVFRGEMFHIGLLKECPERIKEMMREPITEAKTDWETNLDAYCERTGITNPLSKIGANAKKAEAKAGAKKTLDWLLLKEEIDDYLKMGHVAEARGSFASARPEGVDHKAEPELLVVDAVIYVAEGKFDDAIREYTKVLYKNKWNIYYEIAEVYALQGEYKKSLQCHHQGFTEPNVYHKQKNCLKLAEGYRLGRGVAKNEEVSLMWTQEAAARSTKEGEGEAFMDLAEHCVNKTRYADAVKNYEAASKLCDIEAMTFYSEVGHLLNSQMSQRTGQRSTPERE